MQIKAEAAMNLVSKKMTELGTTASIEHYEYVNILKEARASVNTTDPSVGAPPLICEVGIGDNEIIRKAIQ